MIGPLIALLPPDKQNKTFFSFPKSKEPYLGYLEYHVEKKQWLIKALRLSSDRKAMLRPGHLDERFKTYSIPSCKLNVLVAANDTSAESNKYCLIFEEDQIHAYKRWHETNDKEYYITHAWSYSPLKDKLELAPTPQTYMITESDFSELSSQYSDYIQIWQQEASCISNLEFNYYDKIDITDQQQFQNQANAAQSLLQPENNSLKEQIADLYFLGKRSVLHNLLTSTVHTKHILEISSDLINQSNYPQNLSKDLKIKMDSKIQELWSCIHTQEEIMICFQQLHWGNQNWLDFKPTAVETFLIAQFPHDRFRSLLFNTTMHNMQTKQFNVLYQLGRRLERSLVNREQITKDLEQLTDIELLQMAQTYLSYYQNLNVINGFKLAHPFKIMIWVLNFLSENRFHQAARLKQFIADAPEDKKEYIERWLNNCIPERKEALFKECLNSSYQLACIYTQNT